MHLRGTKIQKVINISLYLCSVSVKCKIASIHSKHTQASTQIKYYPCLFSYSFLKGQQKAHLQTASGAYSGWPWQLGTLFKTWLHAQTCSTMMLWAADQALGWASHCSLAAPVAHRPANREEHGNLCLSPNAQQDSSSAHVLIMSMCLCQSVLGMTRSCGAPDLWHYLLNIVILFLLLFLLRCTYCVSVLENVSVLLFPVKGFFVFFL